MDIRNICIIGGSGFVGRSVADHACARGYRVRIATRSWARARELLVLPTLEAVVADPYDDASLERTLADMDAVVNLVGILHEGGRATFEAAHVELPRRIARAARLMGVRHLLHMSALGAAPDAASRYKQSKGRGEVAVRQAAGDLPVTVFRPSVIFGEHDRFLNRLASMARIFPVIPLGGARARFQPVWVEDVARAIAGAIADTRAPGATYEICGPRAYTLEELARFSAAIVDRKPRIVALPDSLARLQAFVFEHLPGKLLTRDNLRSMSVDNVCSGPFPEAFGFKPSSLEAVVHEYMKGSTARARYSQYRHHAGR
jgi:uncharacterized protein YbjT (DUF2867 family)